MLALLLAGSIPVFAHDPYEISSTVRIETNRTLIEVEMEFNGAMLLVGELRSREVVDQAALFQSKLPELQRQAGQFFEVSAAGAVLAASSSNVTLSVEYHVRFNLVYPATRDGLKLNAAGLKSLSEHGPFGTTVTVLDLVNMKVLGQSVLFADSPVAEFAPAVKEPVKLVVTSVATSSPAATPATAGAAQSPAKPVALPARDDWMWILFILGAFAVGLLVLIRRWRVAGGSQ